MNEANSPGDREIKFCGLSKLAIHGKIRLDMRADSNRMDFRAYTYESSRFGGLES